MHVNWVSIPSISSYCKCCMATIGFIFKITFSASVDCTRQIRPLFNPLRFRNRHPRTDLETVFQSGVENSNEKVQTKCDAQKRKLHIKTRSFSPHFSSEKKFVLLDSVHPYALIESLVNRIEYWASCDVDVQFKRNEEAQSLICYTVRISAIGETTSRQSIQSEINGNCM